MTLEPLWIKEVKLETRGLDPLGLSRVSSYLVEELIPGITVLTNRGRNYIFYSWAIHRAITPKFESSRKFYKTIIRLEAANVVGGLLDAEENFPDSKGPIGRNRGLDEIASAKNQGQDYINVDFSVLAHQGGGFGQYYYSSMEKLDYYTQPRTNYIFHLLVKIALTLMKQILLKQPISKNTWTRM